MSAEESDGNVRQVPVLQRSGRAIDDELVEGQDIELQECERRVLRNAEIVLEHCLAVKSRPHWCVLGAFLLPPVDRRGKLLPV